jgi:hypothetical protein
MDEEEAVKHFEAVRSSSSVLPYVTKVRIAWEHRSNSHKMGPHSPAWWQVGFNF